MPKKYHPVVVFVAIVVAVAIVLAFAMTRSSGQVAVSRAALFPPHPTYGPFVLTNQILARCFVPAGVEMDCWGHDGELIDWTQTGKVFVVSTDVQDNSSGTGAASVLITGLSPAGNAIFETVAVNGTTPVLSVNDFQSPIGRAVITVVGSSGDLFAIPAAKGNISFTINGVKAGIIRTDRNENTTLTGAARTAAGITAVLKELSLTTKQVVSGGTGNIDIRVFSKDIFTGTPQIIPTWTETFSVITLPTGGETTLRISVANDIIPGGRLLFRVNSDTDVELGISFLADLYGALQ